MALSSNAVKRLMVALGDAVAGREVADAIDAATTELVSQVPLTTFWSVANLIIATNVSQTVDFGSLQVNDQVLMIPATAGNADQIGPIATAGTLGQAAVVGNAYLVLRKFTVPAAHTNKF
jgi:hypothetical protein